MSTTSDERSAWIRAEVEKTRRTQRRIWSVVGVFIAMALLAVVVLFADENEHAQRVAAGTRAVARVERLQEGFCWVGERHQTCMDIELAVVVNGASFNTVVTHRVPDRWMSRVQPGQWLSVVVDKDDPARALIDDDAFERPPPAPAAL